MDGARWVLFYTGCRGSRRKVGGAVRGSRVESETAPEQPETALPGADAIDSWMGVLSIRRPPSIGVVPYTVSDSLPRKVRIHIGVIVDSLEPKAKELKKVGLVTGEV